MLSALGVTALSFLLLESSWLWGCIFLLIVLKIISLRDFNAIMMICLIILLFGSRYYFWAKNQTTLQALDQVELKDQHFLMYSDETKIQGNLLQAKVLWLEKKRKLVLYYRLKSQTEKRSLQQNKTSQILIGEGKLQKVNPPTNENEFNWQRFYQAQNIALTFFVVRWHQVETRQLSPSEHLAIFLHDLRTSFSQHLQSYPTPLNFYGESLLLGVKEVGFSATLTELNKLGLIYLFSLSGMHVFYFVKALRWCFMHLYFPRELTDLVLLFLLPCYAILGGAVPSLIRAILMCWLALGIRLLFRKKADGAGIWAIVLLLEIFITPAMFQTLGTQLSYLLTLIILLSSSHTNWWFNVKLNLYSLPLVLYHTFSWNIWTLLFSNLATWVFEIIILPVTLLGCFIPGIQSVASYFLNGISVGLHFLAKLPGNIVFGKPPLLIVFIWLGLTIALEIVANKKKLLWFLALSYFLVFMWIHYPLGSEIVYFDIGQGDCTLIRDRFNRRIIMIDTGGKVHFKQANWQRRKEKTTGETIVANYLLSKGIARIDQLYLTHQDADHVGNFASLSQIIKIKQLIVPLGMEKLPSFKHRLALSKVLRKDVLPVTDKIQPTDPNLKLLHPFSKGQGTNKDSLVLWLNFQGISCIFTGDLDRQGELAVLKKYPWLKADIFKTGHHGSKTASDPRFVHALSPRIAIISAGRHNRYGHPDQETLATLKKERIKYYLTAKVGMIKIKEFFQKKSIQYYINP